MTDAPFPKFHKVPSADEIGVCLVAADLVEEGRIAEAKALLEQAPNRLNMQCPVCLAEYGKPCCDRYWTSAADRIVPHSERLTAPLGPLFRGLS